MNTEPSMGEVARAVARVEHTVDALSSRVLTTDVWQSERAHLDTRLRQVEQQVTEIMTRREADSRQADSRRWVVYMAIGTSVLGFLFNIYMQSQGAG